MNNKRENPVQEFEYNGYKIEINELESTHFGKGEVPQILYDYNVWDPQDNLYEPDNYFSTELGAIMAAWAAVADNELARQ